MPVAVSAKVKLPVVETVRLTGLEVMTGGLIWVPYRAFTPEISSAWSVSVSLAVLFMMAPTNCAGLAVSG